MTRRALVLPVCILGCAQFGGASSADAGSDASTSILGDASALDASTGDVGNSQPSQFECQTRSDFDCIDFNGGSISEGYRSGKVDPNDFAASVNHGANAVADGALVASTSSNVDTAGVASNEWKLPTWTLVVRLRVSVTGELEIMRLNGSDAHLTLRASPKGFTFVLNDNSAQDISVDVKEFQVITITYDGATAALMVGGRTAKQTSSKMSLIDAAVGARYASDNKTSTTTIDYLYVNRL